MAGSYWESDFKNWARHEVVGGAHRAVRVRADRHDGREERHDLIILPGRVVRNWWRQDGHGLVLEDLEKVLDELPEHLVIGTGAGTASWSLRGRPPPCT